MDEDHEHAARDRAHAADESVIDLLGSGVAEVFIRVLNGRFAETPRGDVEDAVYTAIEEAWQAPADWPTR